MFAFGIVALVLLSIVAAASIAIVTYVITDTVRRSPHWDVESMVVFLALIHTGLFTSTAVVYIAMSLQHMP